MKKSADDLKEKNVDSMEQRSPSNTRSRTAMAIIIFSQAFIQAGLTIEEYITELLNNT